MRIKNGKIHRSLYEKIRDYFGSMMCKRGHHNLIPLARCVEIEGKIINSQGLMNRCLRYGCDYKESIEDISLRGGGLIREFANKLVDAE